ncbi:MAG: ATP-binding cassette domain-containing protein [ANME-2 cluster archaeon]|nr:ATP-binding cassette domain-containing protein [ANME-2 cluster archaeon]MBC2708285.1 ATP-binding cassette domain-containing protein [ANME-2 cluster archaeon]MBC2763254.1 ATP-binding cassette domain-containing protein [ANME-2 cluster archaeon]
MIEVQDLTKTFNGKTVVNGLNFQVREGEIFGFLGPNGAGKTTTMRIILGLLRPTSGKALVFGADLGSNKSSYCSGIYANNCIFDYVSPYFQVNWRSLGNE